MVAKRIILLIFSVRFQTKDMSHRKSYTVYRAGTRKGPSFEVTHKPSEGK